MIITGADLGKQASDPGYNGISYEEKDCQAFVQMVLHDVGINENWLGSNDMLRNMVDNVQIINGKFDNVPTGAILFTLKADGKEPSRYKKGGGKYDPDFENVNASHVGIYCGKGQVRHSSTGGVQWDNLTSKRWTHYAFHKKITYTVQGQQQKHTVTLEDILNELINVENLLKGWKN